eukprot:TRINITY_DN18408_c0_g1_i2.p1 TRINITY_DN18408_c0_g1~~TRINITY_DN18408_c0_g1_i2.p1  ORF type:complete len:1482 (+),score=319.04 TRINITY_DN18408_c0_g1_i2:56-4501(+)
MAVTTLHGLLVTSADRCPDRTCLKFGSHAGYTYREVKQAMERCAGHVSSLDAPVIALVADRSYGLMVSLLGILRAGKAYCPIEPDFPASRAIIMLETAAVKHLLVPVNQTSLPLLSHLVTNVLAVHDTGRVDWAESGEELPSAAIPDQVPDDSTAYVLFTSGSTGKPKGCMVPHRGSAKYAHAVVQSCKLDEDMVYVLKTPYVFDVSVQDIFVAFCAGGSLVIAEPNAHKDASAMADLIVQHKASCCCFVPTLLVEFANYLSGHSEEVAELRKYLKRVLTIGEALMSGTCSQMFEFFPELQIHNLYGPTEASVGVSHFCTTQDTLDRSTAVVPIGRPFDYVNFCIFDPSRYEGKDHILASDLVAVEDGSVGELFIGGDCLAQGYVSNPEKTNSAFFHFPEVLPRPPCAASQFSLYKTGDLVKKHDDGAFEYLGRNDFQVKIGGVRIECEEVSAVLKTHPFVQDALVAAFDGPFGKALAAYVVAQDVTDWSESPQTPKNDEECSTGSTEDGQDNVAKWGAVYDEMYKETGASISDQDPTLNWSGYVDTYSRKPHIEPVIKEWVEWSCEQVSRHVDNDLQTLTQTCTELGCGNGMLLFRLAPLFNKGKYIGTDISTTALDYIKTMCTRAEYTDLNIDTSQIAAHEIMKVCAQKENNIVLCNGVTMYFPSANYLVDCMATAARATRSDGFVIFGDIQSKRHLLPFRCHVETYHALRRADATALAVLRAAKQTASNEELSYFDDVLFQRLDLSGSETFDGRLARLELRLKRGWWHSEFNRFRYDVEVVLCDQRPATTRSAELDILSFSEVSQQLQLSTTAIGLVDSRLVEQLPAWLRDRMSSLPASKDGMVVQLPNARTLQSVRLLEWLEENADKGKTLTDLPHDLHPVDASKGSPEISAMFGIEPEMLFTMELPDGWTQRVIWDEDPAFLRLVLLRETAAQMPWLGVACGASTEALPLDLSPFKNRPEDVSSDGVFNPVKACNDALKAWASKTTLLQAMRPSVYIAMDAFPKNAAGKVDRGALPDANEIFMQVSDATTIAYEAPATDDERSMVHIWESVLKVAVGVNTPFTSYGGHSLTALQLCTKILSAFGKRPEIAFLTSEDCTVRALLSKMKDGGSDAKDEQVSKTILRLSPHDRRGCALLVFCAAGASASTYQAVADHAVGVEVYAVELPGRGLRAAEALETDFEKLVDNLEESVTSWAARRKNHIYLWGGSLGAVVAYTFACKWQQRRNIALLGLFVSGNAGPTEASAEIGIGASVASHLGLELTSAKDMTQAEWLKFLVASSGKRGEEIKQLLADNADKSLVDEVVAPLRADCLVYESYHLDHAVPLQMPIMTMRGTLDCITSSVAMKSWKEVAGGRLEFKEFPQAGHMLATECPILVAKYMDQATLTDFSSELEAFKTFRAAYRLLRHGQQKTRKGSMIGSPVVGARSVPKDFGEVEIDLDVLPTAITPQTKKVKQMRMGNLEWRRGGYLGNRNDSP